MLLRDRLNARMDEMRRQGAEPDYPLLAAEVLGIRNAPPALARRLVAQALVVEDRREAWQRVGDRIGAEAPPVPGVYVMRDADRKVLYVGKAVNLRRRLRTHFAARRWKGLKAPLARAAHADWEPVGSELEALLREAVLIQQLRPLVNVQVGPPDPNARAVPSSLVKDLIVIVPSVDPVSAEIVCVRPDGTWHQARARRDGRGLGAAVRRIRRFFKPEAGARRSRARNTAGATDPGATADKAGTDVPALAPLVYSWVAGRGQRATRVDPTDYPTASSLERCLAGLLADGDLFTERLEVR